MNRITNKTTYTEINSIIFNSKNKDKKIYLITITNIISTP